MIFGLMVSAFSVLSLPCFAGIDIIRIYNRNAAELLPVVEVLLSESGKVSIDSQTNAIIIKDSPSVLENIRKALAGLDRAPEQVTIRFRFHEDALSQKNAFSVSGKASGGDWAVKTGRHGKKNSVQAKMQDIKQDDEQSITSSITVLSGKSAYVAVGKKIPYTKRWAYFGEQYTTVGESVSFETVETGFDVRPTVTGATVRIEIVPRVSDTNGRVIHFAEASTVLVVPRGKWVSLSRNRQDTQEVAQEILSKGNTESHTTLSFSVFVEP